MISLQKGQAISLKKNDGSSLKRVAMGTGWDAVKKKGFFGFGGSTQEIDLDASALVYSKGRLIDQVWFRQLRSNDGNIVHSGDNRTGDGDGDDEVINVNLDALGANVDAIVFTVNSFTGQTFSDVANAYTRVVDLDTGQEMGRVSLSESGNHTGMIMAALKRTASGWEFKAIGERATGRTFHSMEHLITPHI